MSMLLVIVLLVPAPQPPFKVGTATRNFVPDPPFVWRGAKTHALVTQIWYPAEAAAVEQSQWVGPPDAPLFSAGKAAPDVAVVPSPRKFPLIVVSHGTGGSAAMMAWLGAALAARGAIVAAVNHPGNNALEPYTPQGFLLWWERAHDLSVIVDRMLTDPTFGQRIDSARIGAAGYSLGGYTMIALAGGITEPSAYAEFCKSARADGTCKPPPDVPEILLDRERISSDPEVRVSLGQASHSHRDPRIGAFLAIAPAFGPAFKSQTLERITARIAIVAGAADTNVPIVTNARYFAAHIPRAELTIFPGPVGHFVFLGVCTDQGRRRRPILCTDTPGVDRAAIQARTVDLAARFFATGR